MRLGPFGAQGSPEAWPSLDNISIMIAIITVVVFFEITIIIVTITIIPFLLLFLSLFIIDNHY